MRRSLLPVLAAATAVAGGCSSDRGQVGGPPIGAGSTVVSVPATGEIRTVGLIGDSITVGAETALRTALADLGVDVLAVDAASGRRIVADGSVGSGVEAVERVAETEPDLWVVALGTNDVANLDSVEEYATAIDTLLAAIPDGAPVVWIDTFVDVAEDASASFNRVLRARLAQRGAATVVDWASAAAADGVLRDGVHPDDEGNLVFAGRVADGVAAWLG